MDVGLIGLCGGWLVESVGAGFTKMGLKWPNGRVYARWALY